MSITYGLVGAKIRAGANGSGLRDSLLSEHTGVIGSRYSIVSNEKGLKSSVVDVGNWVISGVSAQGNRQADPMLMI